MSEELIYNQRYGTWDKPDTRRGFDSFGNVSTARNYVTKDSGERIVFESGMQRDVETGKKDYSLCLGGPMFERWAALMTRGAIKYERNNWMKARGPAEEERFVQSAFRHFIQWMNGETDEDHAAAVFFNINGAEYVRSLQKKEPPKNILALDFGEGKVPPPYYPMSPKAPSTVMPELPGTGGYIVRS